MLSWDATNISGVFGQKLRYFSDVSLPGVFAGVFQSCHSVVYWHIKTPLNPNKNAEKDLIWCSESLSEEGSHISHYIHRVSRCGYGFSVMVGLDWLIGGVDVVNLGESILEEESSSCEIICDGNVMDCESDGFKVKEKNGLIENDVLINKMFLVDKSYIL